MAGDWIKMRTNLAEDPAVVRLAFGLNLDRFAIVGRLHKIWSWANEHSTDGLDVPVDAQFLDSLVATPGFAEQLRRVGWLSGRDGSLTIPNFLRHNGESAKSRAMDADRKRRVRKASEKCPDENRTETGPEKRREEKKDNTKVLSKRESDKSDPPAPQLSDGEVVLADWNQRMGQTCRWTRKREVAFRERWKNPKWREAWPEAIQRASASGFCRGENDRGWLADFEWFLKPDTVTKLLEGKYDDRERKPTVKPVTFAQQRQQNMLELVRKYTPGNGADSITGLLESAK